MSTTKNVFIKFDKLCKYCIKKKRKKEKREHTIIYVVQLDDL